MEQYLILEFETSLSAGGCLFALNEVAANYWQSQGYTVIGEFGGKAVLGKNAKTGEDNTSALTITWDTVKESPDGTFYFTSPSSNTRFINWRDYMPDIDMGVEKEMPEDWIDDLSQQL